LAHKHGDHFSLETLETLEIEKNSGNLWKHALFRQKLWKRHFLKKKNSGNSGNGTFSKKMFYDPKM